MSEIDDLENTLFGESAPLRKRKRRLTTTEWRAKGARAAMRKRKSQTHCKNGHPFDDANTYLHHGHRLCKQCNRDSHKRRYAAKTSLMRS